MLLRKIMIQQQTATLHTNQEDLVDNLVIKASDVVDAGLGLFVAAGRKVRKGEVVALYAGAYYPPPPLWSMPSDAGLGLPPMNRVQYMQTIGQTDISSEYQMHCNLHGGYIDGLPAKMDVAHEPVLPRIGPDYHSTALKHHDKHATTFRHDLHHDHHYLHSPYTAGYLINHPPPGLAANVAPVDFCWTEYAHFRNENHQPHSRPRFHSHSHDQEQIQEEPGGPLEEDLPVEDLEEEMRLVGRVNRIGEGVWFMDTNAATDGSQYTNTTTTITTNHSATEAGVVFLSERCTACKGIAIVALEDICGEQELLLDYRYDMNGTTATVPDWYHPVSATTSKQRPD